MAKELAFVLINPYTLRKSRTGGIISRIVVHTGLDLVAARIFCPSQELAEKYADYIRKSPDVIDSFGEVLADYVMRTYTPNPKTGRGHRVMMLLFEGENAVEKVLRATGGLIVGGAGDTVRDTYGDYVTDDLGNLVYVEPAVLIGPTHQFVKDTLALWSQYSESDGGVADFTDDEFSGDGEVQKTLVLIKPDNFRFPSGRPGSILDNFSRSGLKIVAAQVHRMSISEALNFYGPVREILREKLKNKVADMGLEALHEALGLELPPEMHKALADNLGPVYGDQQFFRIIEFMTGLWAPGIDEKEYDQEGNQRCLAIIYKGVNAVEKIRTILGPTDPTKAEPGSVRREYGQDVMVNAAHASDSPENAVREIGIIQPEKDKISVWYQRYFG